MNHMPIFPKCGRINEFDVPICRCGYVLTMPMTSPTNEYVTETISDECWAWQVNDFIDMHRAIGFTVLSTNIDRIGFLKRRVEIKIKRPKTDKDK